MGFLNFLKKEQKKILNAARVRGKSVKKKKIRIFKKNIERKTQS